MTVASCFLVDLDDTIYPELTYLESGYRAVAVHIARTTGTDAAAVFARLHYEQLKFGRTGAFDRLVAHFGWTLSIRELVQVYRAHNPTLMPYPQAFEAIKALRTVAPVAIVTDGAATIQRRKVEALGLADHVDAIVLCDEAGAPKPDPIGYRKAARQLDRAIGEAVIIGDDPFHDLEAARRLMVRAVRVRTGRLADLTVDHAFPEVFDITAATQLFTDL
jgi:putative hydrolase of the HAD superfamily